MSAKIIFSNADDLIQRYIAGESENKLSREVGVNRSAFRNMLLEHNIVPRNQSESERIKWSRMTKEQRSAQVSAAHAAVVGRIVPDDAKRRMAIKRQDRWSNVSIAEFTLADYIQSAGILNFTQQKAIGIYNVDIAIHVPSIAVEIFGGGFHASGTHAIRFYERTKYLLDNGWNVIIIWVDGRRYPLTIDGCKRIITFIQEFSRNPSGGSQYRVILGDGNDAPTTKTKFNSPAVIEKLRSSD